MKVPVNIKLSPKRLHWAEELFWPVIKKPLMPLAKKNAS